MGSQVLEQLRSATMATTLYHDTPHIGKGDHHTSLTHLAMSWSFSSTDDDAASPQGPSEQLLCAHIHMD